MTVSNQQTEFDYTGNGVTVTFAYSCQVQKAGDLQVYVNGSLVTSGITKNGIGSLSGGSVTFSVAPASGAAVRLERAVVLERTTDYQQNGDFLARVVNPDFDRIWMALQQQNSVMGRAIRYPKSDVNPITELPDAATRANRLLGFNDLGQQILFAPTSGSALDLAIALASIIGSTLVGNGGETVAQSFDAMQMASFSVLRAYSGTRKAVRVCSLLTGGAFTADPLDTTSPDDNAMTIIDANGMRWKRQYSGLVDARWFGAILNTTDGTDGADDTAACQAWLNFIATPYVKGFLPGWARITSPMTVAAQGGIQIVGTGRNSSGFKYPTLADGRAPIEMTGGSGSDSKAYIEDIGFSGRSGATGTWAVLNKGICGQHLRRCWIGPNAFAMVLHNYAPGAFTEYNTLDDCTVALDCLRTMYYKISGGGDASFHGSGLDGRTTINVGNYAGAQVIVADPGAYLYNCPLNVQIWVHGDSTLFSQASAGIYKSYFYGTVTIEVFSGTFTMTDSPINIPLAGKIVSTSTIVKMGNMYLCDAVINQASGQTTVVGGKFAAEFQMTTGANLITIPGAMYEGCVSYSLIANGVNYNYRYEVGTFGYNSGGGAAVILATYNQFNVAAYGAPTFSVDTGTGRLIVTNAAWPASGIKLRVEVTQKAQSQATTFFGK